MNATTYEEVVLDVLHENLERCDGVEKVVRRTLTPKDPSKTCGLVILEWVPDEYEIGGNAHAEPTLSHYLLSIQHVVKMRDAEDGLRLHRTVAKSLRLMLYCDPQLTLALGQLASVAENRTERTQRWYVEGQRFANNEIEGDFVFLSNTEFQIDTRTSPA